MKTTFTLYIGNEQTAASARRILRQWGDHHHVVEIAYVSIHTNPSVALRLGIHELPALVLADQVLAQGPPDTWLTEAFLDDLVNQLQVET